MKPASDNPTSMAAMARVMVVTALMFCTMAVITPSVDALVRVPFGVDNKGVGTFYFVHSMPQLLLLGILVGLLSDRWRRRLPLAIACCAGTAITTMLHPFMPSFNALLGLRLLDGALGVVAIGMLMARALDLAHGENRAKMMGLFMASIPVGYLSGSFLTAAVAPLSLSAVFLLTGGALLLSTLTLLPDLRQPERIAAEQPTIREMLLMLRRVPAVWFPVVFGMIDKFTFALIAMLTGVALSDEYGLSAIVWGGSALGLMWLAFLVSSYPAGMLCRGWGSWKTVALGSVAYGVALIVMLSTSSPYVFVAMLAVAGPLIALQSIGTMVLLGELAPASNRGTAMAFFNWAGSLGIMAGFAVGGIVSAKVGYFQAFAIGGALEILAGVVAALLIRRYALGSTPPDHGATAPVKVPQGQALALISGAPPRQHPTI